VAEERLKLAVFIDFDNIQIGVKETLRKEFDVSVVLEALKERGEVVSKTAYGEWSRSPEQSRQMTQHAVQLVQRNVTPRGDKNGADINLALDALEMAFTRDHINAFAIVGGDSDFITLVEKLKQYDKRVFVVGGRQFTSGILQRNCHEFIAYENLLAGSGESSRGARSARTSGGTRQPTGRPLEVAMPNIQRALKVLAEREVAPQLGLLKSTLLQLDPTFSERDYGTGSFLEFIQKLQKARLVQLRKTERGYLVEAVDAESGKEPAGEPAVEAVTAGEPAPIEPRPTEIVPPAAVEPRPPEVAPPATKTREDSLALLKQVMDSQAAKSPERPLYMRQVRQLLRGLDSQFDEHRSGFHGLLDLLHQAQREGLLRLHRDRKGVWRIFPVTAAATLAPPAVESGAEVVPAPEPILAPQEAVALPETDEQAEEAPQELVLTAPEMPAEAAPVEAPAERKPRKPRAARGAGRGRASSRKKSKESAES
jgi:uncharacterized protein (TIGR00288 family)